MAGIVKRERSAAAAAEQSVRKSVRDEARAAVMPWVLLSLAMSLVALRRRRR
jgi:hypothetical protein